MAKTLSTPNVYRNETDLSEITKGAGTSAGAIVVDCKKGMPNSRIRISNDKVFVDKFGIPSADSTADFNMFAGIEFLKESDDLFVVRATAGSEQFANITLSSSASGSLTISAYSSSVFATSGYPDGNTLNTIAEIDNATLTDAYLISSIGCGKYGNNIKIKVFTSASDDDYTWKNKYETPTQIFQIIVFENDNQVESFFVATDYMKDSNGKQLFIEDVINGKSDYIYVKTDKSTAPLDIPFALSTATALENGDDGTNSPLAGDKSKAWELFNDKDKSKVNILIGAYSNDTLNSVSTTINDIAKNSQRMDCIACLQCDSVSDTTTTKVISNTSVSTSSSWSAQYAGWDKYYDSFSDRIIFIPKCIAGAVVMARTDNVANTWDAPAGVNRGGIDYSLGQNVTWNNTDIGDLYDVNINTSKLIRGQGHFIWGQKTCQLKTSALDRINVRRLLLYIENSVEPSLLPFLFEANTDKTRLRVYNMITSFMESIGDGLQKFEVVVDDTNNTPQVIDSNELMVDIYIQPSKSIEFIRLNLIITRSGVDFSEVK